MLNIRTTFSQGISEAVFSRMSEETWVQWIEEANDLALAPAEQLTPAMAAKVAGEWPEAPRMFLNQEGEWFLARVGELHGTTRWTVIDRWEEPAAEGETLPPEPTTCFSCSFCERGNQALKADCLIPPIPHQRDIWHHMVSHSRPTWCPLLLGLGEDPRLSITVKPAWERPKNYAMRWLELMSGFKELARCSWSWGGTISASGETVTVTQFNVADGAPRLRSICWTRR